MSHTCEGCGLVHEMPGQLELADAAAAAPVVEAAPGPNENDVKIAEIQAAAEVELAQTYAAQGDEDLAAEVERLRGELRGLREGLELGADAAAADPPAGPPIVVEPPAAAAPEPEAPAPPPADAAPPAPKRKSSNYFGV